MSMFRSTSRKLMAVLALILAIVICAGATFAWTTSKNTIINPFKNDGFVVDGSAVLVEKFEQKDPVPGAEVKKEVKVLNGGSDDILVRVAFEEMLHLLGNNNETPPVLGGTTWTTANSPTAGFIRAIADPKAYYQTTTAAGTGIVTLNNPLTLKSDWKDVTASIKTDTVNTGNAAFLSDTNIILLQNNDLIVALYKYGTGTPVTLKDFQAMKVDYTLTVYPSATPSYIATPTYGTNYNVKINAAPQYGQLTWTDETLTGTAPNKSSWNADYISWNKKNNANEWVDRYQAGSGTIMNVAADVAKSRKNTNITFKYSSDYTTTLSAGDKWWYCTQDGYFYYLAKIPSGSESKLLLESVLFGGGFGKEAQKIDYRLAITLEAIQAKKAAISGSDGGGWSVADTQLSALLQGLCAD